MFNLLNDLWLKPKSENSKCANQIAVHWTLYRVSGKIGSRAVLYYLTTTFIAVSLGVVLTITIRYVFGFRSKFQIQIFF